MALLIKTDGTHAWVAPADGDAFTLKELQGFVGGYIEMVPALDDDLMVLNEDGKGLRLPLNRAATLIFHVAGGALFDYIVGNVIIGTRHELGGPD